MVTSKKQKEENAALMMAIGVVLFIPFMVFTFIHYAKLKSNYPKTDGAQRVFDFGNLFPALLTGGAAILVSAYIIAIASSAKLAMIIVPIVFVGAVWVCYKIAKSIASTYYGMIVDPQSDHVLLPKDMANYGIEDYIQLKFIRELGEMESVPLSQITKITREAGKKLFIHGQFGSRGIYFSNKQKRDECIAAIEYSSRVSATLDFESA